MTEIGRNSFGIDPGRERERTRELAVAALDLMVLLAGDARVTAALQRDLAVVHLDADLVASQTG